jgi:hypothetical protein
MPSYWYALPLMNARNPTLPWIAILLAASACSGAKKEPSHETRALRRVPLHRSEPAGTGLGFARSDGRRGPAAAKQRLIGPSLTDEHRQISLKTLMLANAPAFADRDMMLATFTKNAQSLQPARFDLATHLALRVHSPSEFSQLPDFSYSLWDWALRVELGWSSFGPCFPLGAVSVHGGSAKHAERRVGSWDLLSAS